MREYILRLCVGLVILLLTISLAQGWVARYDGPGHDNDYAVDIALDNSGNVYVTGGSWGSGSGFDYATVKYDLVGGEQWVSRYNGPGNGEDQPQAIALDNSGNVYVTGWSWGSDTKLDYATIKYDSNGDTVWVRRYNGLGNDEDVAHAIAIDDAGNVYVTGWSKSSAVWHDIVTVKYDSLGEQKWVETYNGLGNGHDGAHAIALDNSGNVYVTGPSQGSGTGFDFVTISYYTGIAEEIATSVENSYLGATIFSGPLLLPEGKNCRVFDITGRVVTPDKIQPGIYFIEIDGEITHKVVKIR